MKEACVPHKARYAQLEIIDEIIFLYAMSLMAYESCFQFIYQ